MGKRCVGVMTTWVCLLIVGAGAAEGAGAEDVFAGAAKVELTPATRVPLAGYSRRKGRLSTGVHDPVFARALVLRQGSRMVAIASCDLLIIDEHLAAAVGQRVADDPALSQAVVMLAATHTHSGPGAYGRKFVEKISMGHYDPDVFDLLVDRIVEAIRQASRAMRPAAIRYASATTDGAVTNRMRADGPVDPELAGASISDESNQPVAVLVGFGAHPTTLGAWNFQLSGDYPGVLASAIEREFPSAVCLFLPGAVGDQAPIKRGEGFEPAEALGRALAHRIIPALREASVERPAHMAALQRIIRLPPPRVRVSSWEMPAWLGASFVDDDATLTALRLGQMILVGLPCDATASIGMELKRHIAAQGYRPVVVGFAQDYIGYCLTPEEYELSSYESEMAFNGPETGRLLVEELTRMVDVISDE